MAVQKYGFWNQMPAELPCVSCGNNSQVVNLSKPQFLPLYNGDDHTYITGMLWPQKIMQIRAWPRIWGNAHSYDLSVTPYFYLLAPNLVPTLCHLQADQRQCLEKQTLCVIGK